MNDKLFKVMCLFVFIRNVTSTIKFCPSIASSGNYILHAITVNRFSAPNRSNNTFRVRLTRDPTLVCTRAAQPYRPDSRDSTARGARRSYFSLSLSLSLSFLHLATHYPVSVHERVSPINLSGESRLNLEREFYLASFNCSMGGAMGASRWPAFLLVVDRREIGSDDDFQTLEETRVSLRHRGGNRDERTSKFRKRQLVNSTNGARDSRF